MYSGHIRGIFVLVFCTADDLSVIANFSVKNGIIGTITETKYLI